MSTLPAAFARARRAMIELKLAAVIFALVAGLVAITLEWRAAHPAKVKSGVRTVEHRSGHPDQSSTVSTN